jgi:hypothetical protein
VASPTTRNISCPLTVSDQAAGSASDNLSESEHATRDPWIFREGRKSVSGPGVVRGISTQLRRGSLGWVDALIQAGELEAALADAGHSCASSATELTDALAAAVCTGVESHAVRASEMIGLITPPDWVSISPPEGFTYYALHPLDFARVTVHLPPEPRPYAVIGIRSIGTTLSAMAVAAIMHAGRASSRITVRPTGHPYARHTEFDREQHQWIRERLLAESRFAIVDEGPGRSGSTFLSVAEALLRAGVSRESITIVGSREPDPESLCAENAAGRWREFHYLATSPSVNSRFKECLYAGGGCWRDFFFADKHDWPESWTQTERLKFISSDQKTLFKFEGMGRIGADARQRAFALSEAGFSPPARDAGDGFLVYELLDGKHLASSDMSSSLLDTMARYCAFRASNFAEDSRSPSQLKQMVEFNIQQEFGLSVVISEHEFHSQNPVLVDGRMQPHEWVSTGPDNFIKTDAIDHGDNHFFPGPCDIAWDLAGIAMEWQLRPSVVRRLLQEFARQSGVDIAPRLPAYLLAYAVFRMSFCRMARDSVRGSAEQPRLAAAYRRYRNEVAGLLATQSQFARLRQTA